MVVFVICSCNVVKILVVMRNETSISVLAQCSMKDTYFQIVYGGTYTKEYILKVLWAGVAPTVFIPLSVSIPSFVQYHL
jgi:hypothetical protein